MDLGHSLLGIGTGGFYSGFNYVLAVALRGLDSPDIVIDSIEVIEAGGDTIIVEIVSHDRDNLADEERSAVIADESMGWQNN